jgi:hypothetical protein
LFTDIEEMPMGLGDALEAFGPVLTVIGSLALLGRQILSARPGNSAPASLPEAPLEREDAATMVVVHIHLPRECRECQSGEPPR